MEWVLVLYIYAGAFASGDSVALTTIPMQSQEACQSAGKASGSLVTGSAKVLRFVCVKNR